MDVLGVAMASSEANSNLLVEENTDLWVGLIDGEEESLGSELDIAGRVWEESKKLWHIAGPAMISRVITNVIIIITQAFAGHVSDLDLAAISIVLNVIVGFDMGLLVFI